MSNKQAIWKIDSRTKAAIMKEMAAVTLKAGQKGYNQKRKEIADKYGISASTIYAWEKVLNKNTTSTHTYTLPEYLSVGDMAVVVESVDKKDNDKIIEITKIGKIFIEGKTMGGKNVAAYKVDKNDRRLAPASEDASVVTPETEPEPEVAPPSPVQSLPDKPVVESAPEVSDEIVWEKKLVYDIQTANHFYKVKVEKSHIEIIDGEEGIITIKRDRLDDIHLITKNLPKLLQED